MTYREYFEEKDLKPLMSFLLKVFLTTSQERKNLYNCLDEEIDPKFLNGEQK